jgi:hypothetical protein
MRDSGAAQIGRDPDPCHYEQARPETLATIAPVATAAVTWLLVIVGWWVVHKAATKRARRQEELSMVDAIRVRAEALRDRAVAYHTHPVDSSSKMEESRLKHEVLSLVAEVMRLHVRKPKHYDLTSEAMNLRMAITGGAFESSLRERVGHSDPVVLGIWLAVEAVIDRMKEEFEKANADS